MVTLKAKRIGKETYYYIQHSIRKGSKVQKKEKYLGRRLPKDIEEEKKRFLEEFRNENLYLLFEKIRAGFLQERKRMPKSAAEKETETFAIRFTYDTQRIEGSKLTLRETANLLERGISPPSRPLRDIKEAEAHKKVFYEMLQHNKDLSMQAVLYWHKKLLESTSPEIAGRIRQHQVAISGSRFIPPFPAEIFPMLKDFFGWCARSRKKMHMIKLAALAHLKFVTIHPFTDGNGRISRLLMNFILHKQGYPMMDIPYDNRTAYYNALERSQTMKNEDTFLQWFFRQYLKEFRRYMRE